MRFVICIQGGLVQWVATDVTLEPDCIVMDYDKKGMGSKDLVNDRAHVHTEIPIRFVRMEPEVQCDLATYLQERGRTE